MISGLPFAARSGAGTSRTEIYISNVDIPTGYSKVSVLVGAGTGVVNMRQQGGNIADTSPDPQPL